MEPVKKGVAKEGQEQEQTRARQIAAPAWNNRLAPLLTRPRQYRVPVTKNPRSEFYPKNPPSKVPGPAAKIASKSITSPSFAPGNS
jgi:hypothetical protein